MYKRAIGCVHALPTFTACGWHLSGSKMPGPGSESKMTSANMFAMLDKDHKKKREKEEKRREKERKVRYQRSLSWIAAPRQSPPRSSSRHWR